MIEDPQHDDVLVSDDEQRWRDAESILDGAPTESAERRLHQARRRMWTFVASVVVLSLVVGAAVGWLLVASDPGGGSADVAGWQSATSLALTGVAIGLYVVGFVKLKRSGQLTAGRRAPALVLSWAQRRQLRSWMAGKQPVEPGRLRLVRDTARRFVGQGVMARRARAFLVEHPVADGRGAPTGGSR